MKLWYDSLMQVLYTFYRSAGLQLAGGAQVGNMVAQVKPGRGFLQTILPTMCPLLICASWNVLILMISHVILGNGAFKGKMMCLVNRKKGCRIKIIRLLSNSITTVQSDEEKVNSSRIHAMKIGGSYGR